MFQDPVLPTSAVKLRIAPRPASLKPDRYGNPIGAP
jgi:hypothetical protein